MLSDKFKNISGETIFVVFVFVIMLFLSWPGSIKSGDDYYYSFICDSNTMTHDGIKTPMTHLSELIPSQIEHYKYVNGRFLAHTLVQLYVNFLGYNALTITKALLAVLMMWLLCRLSLSQGRKKVSFEQGMVVFAVFMLMMPCYCLGTMFSSCAGILWGIK